MAPRIMQLFKQFRFLVFVDDDVVPCPLVYQDPFLDAVVIRSPHEEERDPHLMGRLKERVGIMIYLLGAASVRPIRVDYDPMLAKYAPIDLDTCHDGAAMQTIYLMGAKTKVLADLNYADKSLPEAVRRQRTRQ